MYLAAIITNCQVVRGTFLIQSISWTHRLWINYGLFVRSVCLFFCLGLMSLFNIWGHIATVPICSSGALTNVMPHRNAMPQTQDTTPHRVTVYRHNANLSLCYPLMWNITLKYTATQFTVFGQNRPGNTSATFYTHQRTLNSMLLLWW